MKKISIDDSIYKIVEANPELKSILVTMGFEHLNDKRMYQTMAKVVTLRKAARMHNLPFGVIRQTLNEFGFDLIEEELK